MASHPWPDGTPRGSTGAPVGVKDGHAVRRADGFENADVPAFGWLRDTPVAKSDPQGSAAVEYGPSSKLWNRKG
jgi:hypothetical protein